MVFFRKTEQELNIADSDKYTDMVIENKNIKEQVYFLNKNFMREIFR